MDPDRRQQLDAFRALEALQAKRMQGQSINELADFYRAAMIRRGDAVFLRSIGIQPLDSDQ